MRVFGTHDEKTIAQLRDVAQRIRLVVLDVDSFARLSERHPTVALKVMRNLSRALCLRLYAHNAD